MFNDENRPEWKRLLAGGFSFTTAPFAMHPADKARAKSAVKLARELGIAKQEFFAAARAHLEQAQGWPTNIGEQLARVEKFVGKQLEEIELLH
jgi:hypothetical protein